MDVLILTCSEPQGVLCLLKTAHFNLFLLFFFRYLDRYRDIKDINEEVLQEKLKTVHPFKPSTDPKYPLYRLQLENRGLPSWLKKKRRNATHKVMQWEDQYCSLNKCAFQYQSLYFILPVHSKFYLIENSATCSLSISQWPDQE